MEELQQIQRDAGQGPDPESASDKCCSCLSCKVKGLMCILLILLVALAVVVPRLYMPSCPDGWVGYQWKCYYFPEAEGNWTYSQSNCSALGTSLVGIDSLQELTFLKRHKGPNSHWIGLRREGEVQPWKWANGAVFNNLFNVTESENCAYLTSELVSSSNCLTAKKWICSKRSVH